MNHGEQRLGYVTASVAGTIMRGSQEAWETLSKRMWADDGSEFGVATHGPRAHGHRQEPFGIAKFWERHPALERIEDHPPFLAKVIRHNGQSILIGCSPDALFHHPGDRKAVVGIQVKSPVERGTFMAYVPYCCRFEVPPEHRDQVQHELLASGAESWWFVAHHEDEYTDTRVAPDPAWRERYLPRLAAFWKFHNDNIQPERSRLGSPSDIGSI